MDVPKELFDRYSEGTLPAAESKMLENWINADKANAMEFLRHIALHTHLHAYLHPDVESYEESEAAVDELASPPSIVERAIRRPTPLSWGIAALVIGLMVTMMGLVAVPFYRGLAHVNNAPPPKVVAQITEMNNVQWSEKDVGRKIKTYLLDGQQVELVSGLVELTFNSGARVVVAGPAKLGMSGENGLQLTAGRLAALVPPVAKGFAVTTSAARFIDLGTEFSVGIDGSQGASLFVREGSVAYQLVADRRQVIVGAGEGVTIGGDGIARRTDTEPPQSAKVPRNIERKNLIVNGGFETADVDAKLKRGQRGGAGWKDVGTERVHLADIGTPAAGKQCMQFTGQPRGGSTIEQQFATTPGTEYVLTYFVSYAGYKNGKPTFVAQVITAEPNEPQQLLRVVTTLDWKKGQWQPLTHRFTATTTLTTLRFAEPDDSLSDGVAPLLDAVSVVAATELDTKTRNNHE